MPLRLIAYITRLDALTPAFELARAELTIARKISTQPVLQKTSPRCCHGFACSSVSAVKFGKPVPITQA